MSELKPCPFCGREPCVHTPDFKGDEYQISCRCGDGPGDDDGEGAVWRNGATFEEAAERWNRRASEGAAVDVQDAAPDDVLLHDEAIEEAALAVMQLSGGPSIPPRFDVRVAVESYLQYIAARATPRRTQQDAATQQDAR